MSNKKFLIEQSGPELQKILNRDVVLTEAEFEELKATGEVSEDKFYYIIEE